MSQLSCLAPAALVLCLCSCASTPGSDRPAPAPGQAARTEQVARSTSGAQPGDTVYLVRHYIRPERQSQFEDFVQAVLWPAFRKRATAQPAQRDMTRSVRLLEPVRPEDDGVLTYTFMLDPYVRGEAYNVFEVLRGVYAEDEARRQYSRFTETWARDFTTHAYTQSRGQATQ